MLNLCTQNNLTCHSGCHKGKLYLPSVLWLWLCLCVCACMLLIHHGIRGQRGSTCQALAQVTFTDLANEWESEYTGNMQSCPRNKYTICEI